MVEEKIKQSSTVYSHIFYTVYPPLYTTKNSSSINVINLNETIIGCSAIVAGFSNPKYEHKRALYIFLLNEDYNILSSNKYAKYNTKW